MLRGPAGLAALAGWADSVATRVGGCYIAFDMDALDAEAGWALAMPERDGMSLATAIAAVRTIAAAMPVVGIGTTTIMIRPETPESDIERTVDAVAALGEAALGEALAGAAGLAIAGAAGREVDR
jgi:arginase family enzyme